MAGSAERLAEGLLVAKAPERRRLLARIEHGQAVIEALRRRADAQRWRDAREALRIARIAIETARAVGDDLALATAEHALGNALHDSIRHREALPCYQRAIERYRRLGVEMSRRRAELSSIDALFHLGRQREAEALARRMRAELRAASDRVSAAKMLVNLANVRHSQDRHREALSLLAEARPALRAGGEELVLAHVDLNRANSFSQLSQFRRSAVLYRAARAAYLALGRSAQVALVDYNEGYDRFLQGRIHEARELMQRAREVFRREGMPHALALASLDEAEIELYLDLPGRALEAAREAGEAFARSGGRLGAARAEVLAAGARRRLGLALPSLEPARATFRDCGNRAGVSDIALLLAADPDRAIAERARLASAAARGFARAGLRRRAGMAEVLGGAISLERGRSAEARRGLERALRSARRDAHADIVLRAEQALGRLAEDEQDLLAARRHFRRAIAAGERARAGLQSDADRLAFGGDQERLFQDALRVALDLGRPAEAFLLVERVRSRALVDLLGSDPRFLAAARRGGGRLSRRLQALKLRIREMEARARHSERRQETSAAAIPAVKRDLAVALAAHERVLGELVRREPELALRREGAAFADPEALCAELGPERSLVAWFREGGTLGALVVDSRGLDAVRGLAPLGRIESALRTLRFALDSPRLESGRQGLDGEAMLGTALAALGALYDLLLAPLERRLAGRDLVLVPTAPLHLVPFHALGRNGRPILLDREVSIAPSASVLLAARRRPARTGRPLVLAAPDARAPLIAEEGRAVAAALGATLLSGAEASAAALRTHSRAARVLHIAAHGVFEPREPLLSGLELSDGRLLLPEIAGLDLGAALVVLSACESGAGLPQGDEVQGLVRSFLNAGARAVLASLWPVQDAGTAQLMRRFHHEIQRGERGSAALRSAALALREEQPHPFFWAPFQLVGSWDAVYSKTRQLSRKGTPS